MNRERVLPWAYLDFRSHHQTNVKKGTVKCLYDHVRCIAQQRQNLMEEENHIMKPFIGIILIHSSVLPLLPSPRGSKIGKGRRGHPLSTFLT